MKLYYAPGACSIGAHIALEEIGAPYETVRLVLLDGDHKKPEYLAINPRGRVPTLEVEGRRITENAAILSYLGLRFPDSGLYPFDDLLLYARVQELISFFTSSVHIAFSQYWRMERFTADPTAYDIIQEGGRWALLRYAKEIEGLTASQWLLGERFSVADVYPFMFFRWCRRVGMDMTPYRNWAAHSERMLARPAVARTVESEGLSPAEFLPER